MTPQRGLLLAMSGSVAMVFLDQTVVGVVLETLRTELGMGKSALEWVVTAYLLAYGSLVQVGGYLGDRLGQRRTFFAGVGLFTLSSLLVGLAPGPEILLLGRGLQGAGAALMQPASLALVAAAFPREVRGRALSLYYNVGSAALVLGPVVGGLVTDGVGWRWVFLLNVPLALATVAMAAAWCPADSARPAAPFDRRGAAALVLGLTALVLALQEGPTWGWRSPLTVGCLVAGVGLLGLLVRLELGVRDPVLDLRLFADRWFTGDLLAVVAVRFALVGITVFLALWLQRTADLTATAAGLVMLPPILVMVATTALGGRLLDRHGPRWVNGGGLAVMAVGHLAAVPALQAVSPLGLAPGLLLVGAGAGFATAANSDAVIRAAPEARGRAAALTQTMRQVGGALGVPLVGMMVLGPDLGLAFAMLGALLLGSAAAVVGLQR